MWKFFFGNTVESREENDFDYINADCNEHVSPSI